MLRMPYDLQVNDETVAADEPIGPAVVRVRSLQLSRMRSSVGGRGTDARFLAELSHSAASINARVDAAMG